MTTLDIPATVVGTGFFTTTVGGATCISANDGSTSYLQEHVALGSGTTSGFNDQIRFPATTIPGTVVSTSLVTVTKGNDGRSFGKSAARFMLTQGPTTYFWTTVFADGTTDWTELVTPLTDGSTEVVTKAMIEAGDVEYNPGHALLNASWTGPIDVTLQWTYIALRVVYTPAAPPPRRRFPREDGYGIGPTRHYPPPSSRRHVGGII